MENAEARKAGQPHVSAQLAAKAFSLAYEELSPETVTIAKLAVLDVLGVSLAGSREPLATIIAEDVIEQGARPEVMIFGRPERTSVFLAALANGTIAHALDYDDSNPGVGHVSCVAVPALLALAEARRESGRSFIACLAAAYDVAGGVGALALAGLGRRGFHSTGTLGSFASAAGCAKMLALDADRIAMALGIAATQTAGLQASFGTMCKPLHAGKAAQNGLLAARLAAKGFIGNAAAIEAERGFARAHSDTINLDAALDRPGDGSQITQTMFKYHAACHMTHPAIECALALRKAHPALPERIASILVRTDSRAEPLCSIADPGTGLEAKFSLRQNIAFALAGVPTAAIETYSDSAVWPDIVEKLRAMTTAEYIDHVSIGYTELAVTLENGEVVRAQPRSLAPDPDLAAQAIKLQAKFLALASPVIGEASANRLAQLVSRLEDVKSMTEITSLCTPAAQELDNGGVALA
ncbi:MAG: 2-methylcitrate dehydratase [Bradyrhizobium sp.]|nr:2-methylcitrate dehydratase [Bradyrhizobium sp.]